MARCEKHYQKSLCNFERKKEAAKRPFENSNFTNSSLLVLLFDFVVKRRAKFQIIYGLQHFKKKCKEYIQDWVQAREKSQNLRVPKFSLFNQKFIDTTTKLV